MSKMWSQPKINFSAIRDDIISQMKRQSIKDLLEDDFGKRNQPIDHIRFDLPSKLNLSKSSTYARVVSIEREILGINAEFGMSESKAREIAQTVVKDLETVFNKNDLCVNGRRVVNDFIIYGSFLNGLCCNDSDIDFFLGSLGNISREDEEDTLKKIWEMFANNSHFDRIECILAARVPIVVFVHKSTNKECSIALSSQLGVKNSLITKLYVCLNPNLKVLTLFLKRIIVQYNLHGTRKIKTHILFWFVVFFLQQKHMLPPIKDVHRAATMKHFVDNWNCSIPSKYVIPEEYTNTNESIVSLYMGFLKFYKNFNFLKYVICPYLGYALRIDDFEKWDIPEEALIRTSGSKNDGKNTFRRSVMNATDPCILSLNVCRGIQAHVANDFRKLCQYFYSNCYDMLNSKGPFDNGSRAKLAPEMDLFGSYNQVVVIEFEFEIESVNKERSRLIAAICNLMENILQFECMRIVNENIFEIILERGDPSEQVEIPMTFIDYRTTDCTLKNGIMVSIFDTSTLQKNFEVFFMCEFPNNGGNVRISVDGNAHFIRFMRNCGKELMLDYISMYH